MQFLTSILSVFDGLIALYNATFFIKAFKSVSVFIGKDIESLLSIERGCTLVGARETCYIVDEVKDSVETFAGEFFS